MAERSAADPAGLDGVAGDGDVEAANRKLALLNDQVDGMRSELAALRRELAGLKPEVDRVPVTHLLEANQQLVLSALRAETLAETAVSNLAQLARYSERDALTDTPNRALMLDRLERAMALARRRRTRVALLFADLDGFKQINDALGHAVGDQALQLASRRLESVVRGSDTVSRHSGDEFLVLLASVAEASDAALIAGKMIASLAEPAVVGDQLLRLSASIGIAIFPDDGEDADALISKADAAMFRSKRRKPGGFVFHRLQVARKKGPQPTAAGDGRRQADRYDALKEHASGLRDIREANEQLVISAMMAQELKIETDESHRRQIKFLAIVAHELRNPLGPIKTAAELLKRAHPDEQLLARLQAMITRQVAHMAKLVDDLLDGSRVSSGKFRLEFGAVELAEILALASESCQASIDARRQHLRMELPGTALELQADPVRLTQIFSNLLDNASKYTQQGGSISVKVAVLEAAVAITVLDNGIGISAAVLPHVFDLFVQDPLAREQHGGGLGIGLAVVRELVEAHGGIVVGESAGKDLGSEFTVTLPLAGQGHVREPAPAIA